MDELKAKNSADGAFIKIDHLLALKRSLNNHPLVGIIQSIFLAKSRISFEINNSNISGKF